MYEIWLSESSGLISWLVIGQIQQDEYPTSLTIIGTQIGQQKIAITEATIIIIIITKVIMLMIIMIVIRMVIVTDDIKNSSNNNNNSNNK